MSFELSPERRAEIAQRRAEQQALEAEQTATAQREALQAQQERDKVLKERAALQELLGELGKTASRVLLEAGVVTDVQVHRPKRPRRGLFKGRVSGGTVPVFDGWRISSETVYPPNSSQDGYAALHEDKRTFQKDRALATDGLVHAYIYEVPQTGIRQFTSSTGIAECSVIDGFDFYGDFHAKGNNWSDSQMPQLNDYELSRAHWHLVDFMASATGPDGSPLFE